MENFAKEIIVKCNLEEMTKSFFKEYMIIWHDPNVNSQENQNYIAPLKKFCEVSTFTEWQEARDYIQATSTICHVITSGTNGKLLVEGISQSASVADIYIFCGNNKFHSAWAKNYEKVSSVETNMQDIIPQIQNNLLKWYKKSSSLKLNLPAFAPIFNDSDKSEMNHLHRYLKVIPNFKNREQAKIDFINLSRAIYSDSTNTKLIADFEGTYNQYNKDQTLRWYTKESFLYKVTNNCLRIATSDSIQYCRLLLKDIEQAIREQYKTKSKNFSGLLYRGAYLSQEEWTSLKENLNREVEMHGFLSVSKEKDVALNFMQADPSKKVLITILVQQGATEEEQGFAEIEEYSLFPAEKEILFNVRSRFTVLETEDEYSEELPYRHLVLLYGAQGFRKFITEHDPIQQVTISNIDHAKCDKCKIPAHEMFEKILYVTIETETYYCWQCINSDDSIYDAAPLLCIPIKKDQKIVQRDVKGWMLIYSENRGQPRPFYGYKCLKCQAKKKELYFKCINCNESQKAWCKDCFGNTLSCLQGGHNIILEAFPFSFWSEEMSENELNHLKFHEKNKVSGLQHVFQQAEMYFQSHKYEKAIECFNIYIQQNEAHSMDENLIICYSHLGNIYQKQGDYDKGLEYHLKSLEARVLIYGADHPDIAASFNNIGGIYREKGEYQKALEYYLKFQDLYKSVYGEDHPDIATCNSNIGNAYFHLFENQKALEYHLKALAIRKSVFGDKHPEVASSYNDIASVFKNCGELEEAVIWQLKSLDIRKAIYGENHPSIAVSYNNIGAMYDDLKEYDKALEYHFKSLEIRKLIYGEDHPSIATAYNNIGMVCKGQGKFEKALECFLKCIKISVVVYGGSHPHIASSFGNIGLLYESQERYVEALGYHMQGLQMMRLFYDEDHLMVAVIKKKIVELVSILEIDDEESDSLHETE